MSVVSLGCFTLEEKPLYPLDGRRCGSQSQFRSFGAEENHVYLPGIQQRIPQLSSPWPSHDTDYRAPAVTSQ